MQDDLSSIIEFMRVAIRMKETYRFTPKENGAFENDAEHTWSVALLCMLLATRLQEELNVELDIARMLKMTIVHDLAEVITGDTKTWDKKARLGKEEREREAVGALFSKLPDDLRDEFLSLWEECEARITTEAKIVKSLDRIEPVLHRVFLDHGWKNLKEDDMDRTVEALNDRQLPRHEFSDLITKLFEQVRDEAVDRDMF